MAASAASPDIAPGAVPLARGCIEDLRLEPGWLHLAGWMFRAGEPLDEVLVAFGPADSVPGAGAGVVEVLGAAARVERPDVGATWPAIPEALRAGFFGSFPLPPGGRAEWHTLHVLGRRGGATVTRFELTLPADLAVLGPTPEPRLMHRVAHIVEPRLFRFDGLRTAHDVALALARHGALGAGPARSCGRILDWGSGSARVACVLRERLRGWSIAGCDVDAEAVDWCRANVPGIAFDTITPEPRLPYADASFDAVLGLSVFTHLTRAEQAAWAGEVRRVLAPGGLFLPTTHGATAARLMGTDAIRAELAAHGISDSTLDATLDGVLPSGAYRATFQTIAWTRARFERGFDVLEATDAGVAGFQDLWVLRAPAPEQISSHARPPSDARRP